MHGERRNNNESRRRRTISLQQSISSSGSSANAPNTRTTRSSTASDAKKISIQAIHERMARLSMDNHLPVSKLPRLQSSKSQQTRLDPLQIKARATKSETTARRSRLRSSTATTAMMAEQDTRRFVLKNNANIHSIWLQNPIEEKIDDDDDHSLVEAAQSRLRSLTLAREHQLDLVHEIKRTFGDILDNKEDDGNQLIRQLKAHIDQQALQIQDLERALTRERAKHTKEHRAKFEAERRALLEQQQGQFEALKQKYRMGLERIVNRWLSNEAAEQEEWMDHIRQQADERVAHVEQRWQKRAASMQAELRQYQNQNIHNLV